MSTLNAVLGTVFDGLLWPLRDLSDWVGLAVMALLTAVAILAVFRYASNQEALAEVKRKIHACLFEIRLFNDDLRAILRAQTEILRHNATYLKLSLKPTLWFLPPLVLVFIQLQFHYGYDGLRPGEPAILSLRLSEAAAPAAGTRPDVGLELPAGLRAETPGVWAGPRREMAWRIAALEPGRYEATVRLDGEAAGKSVYAGGASVRRSPIRHRGGFVDRLLYPAEPPLPAAGPFEAIELDYPDRAVGLAGYEMPWWLPYFVLALAFAFLLRGLFGVTI